MKGLTRLSNLGNTCYMNVALQVLSHTKELVIYFIKDEFKKDLEKKKQHVCSCVD